MSQSNDFPHSQASSLPTALIRIDKSDDGVLTTNATYPIRQPKKYKDDFIVQVFASTLYECRRSLNELKDETYPFGELLLGLGTAGIGATAGALAADISLATWKGVLFFVVIPPLTVAILCAYYYRRKELLRQPAQLAKRIFDELPDPDQTTEIGAKEE